MTSGRAILLALSIGALALAARAVLVEPPPLWLAILIAVVYVLVILAGVLVPSLEMFGDILLQVPGATGRVGLTFDDGPHPESTPQVLDLLKERGARATFFVLGERAAAHPSLIQRMVNEGHTVGLHSYDHYRLYAMLPPKSVLADLERCRDAIEEAAGLRPIWFRPPVGQVSTRTAGGAKLAGAELVCWSVRSRDGIRATTASEVSARVKRSLKPGAIVLLHDAWERPKPTDHEPPAGVRALPEILDACAAAGLAPVSLDELLVDE